MLRSLQPIPGLVAWIAVTGLFTGLCSGQEPRLPFRPLSAEASHVPQTLLPLVHAAEVQEELGLTADSLAGFLEELRVIDAQWWPARNRPPAESRRITAELEARMLKRLREVAGAPAVMRLRQLELQAQGPRALVRPEVAEYLGLTKEQILRLAKAIAATERAAAEAAKQSAEESALEEVRDAERRVVDQSLTSDQARKLATLLGEMFDTASLDRIYPLAPELVDSGHWTSEKPLTLESLRGRVVLLHFYAFQCHNCVANFPHYKRWHKTFSDKGVVVIGIQTPETQAERDVLKVKQAAKEQGFEFPVLIDLQNKNWDAWGNTMWPTVYIIDKDGYIRGWWQGELNWDGATGDRAIEEIVNKLLEE